MNYHTIVDSITMINPNIILDSITIVKFITMIGFIPMENSIAIYFLSFKLCVIYILQFFNTSNNTDNRGQGIFESTNTTMQGDIFINI